MNTQTETEYVATLKMTGELGGVAFNLDDPVHVNNLLTEARDLIDGSYMPGDVDDPDEPALVTIEVRRMPAGYVASLPEFEGW